MTRNFGANRLDSQYRDPVDRYAFDLDKLEFISARSIVKINDEEYYEPIVSDNDDANTEEAQDGEVVD